MAWGDYVRDLTSGDSQVAIEARTGISQGTISRWLKGKVAPEPAQAAKLAQAYGGNVLEAFVAAGFLSEEDAGLPPRIAVPFDKVIDADPDLSREAKIHIKNQYGLLKAASVTSRTAMLREQILQTATLDEQTKAQLIATIDGRAVDAEPVPDLTDTQAIEDWLEEEPLTLKAAARKPGRRGSKGED